LTRAAVAAWAKCLRAARQTRCPHFWHAPPSHSSHFSTSPPRPYPRQTEELLIKRRSLLEKKIVAELEKAKEQTLLKNKRGKNGSGAERRGRGGEDGWRGGSGRAAQRSHHIHSILSRHLFSILLHPHPHRPPAALMALKKKKMYEVQLEAVENNILRVNEQQMMLENQRTTVETVSALRNAAQASKQTMSEMKINDVDTVLDEINEQTDQMQQIQDAMAQPIGAAADLDEDSLMNELEALEAEQLDAELLAPAAPVPTTRVAAPTQAMPAVPAGKAKAKAPAGKSAEELELEALEKEMAA